MAPIQFSKSIVYFGGKYVELNDGEVTLGDLCEVFEVPYEPGTNLKDRDTGSIIATLPSDIVTAASYSDVKAPCSRQQNTEDSELAEVAEFFPHTEENIDAKSGNLSENDNEEEKQNDGGARLLEFFVPSSVNKPSVSGEQTESAAERALDSTRANAAHPSAANSTALMDDVFLELARLGAVELLMPELPQRLAHLPSYEPQCTSGLLGHIIYPPSVYSPYRSRCDPLDPLFAAPHASKSFRSEPKASLSTEDFRSDSAWQSGRNGAPYFSALDTYDVVGCEPGTEAAMLRSRPDLVPFKDGEMHAIFRNYE